MSSMQAGENSSGGAQSCAETLEKIRGVLEEALRGKKTKTRLPIYWSEGRGFAFHASLGGGIGMVVQAFCDENDTPRLIGFYPGAIQAFRARGEDKLARFLIRLLEAASASSLLVSVTSAGDLAAEARIPVFALLKKCSKTYGDEDLELDVLFSFTAVMGLGLWINGIIKKLDELEDIPRFDLENPQWFVEEERRARLNTFNPI